MSSEILNTESTVVSGTVLVNRTFTTNLLLHIASRHANYNVEDFNENFHGIDDAFSKLSGKVTALEKALEEGTTLELEESVLKEIASFVELTLENLNYLVEHLTFSAHDYDELVKRITLTAEQLASLKGEQGDSYTITANDYLEIAKRVTLTAEQLEEIAHRITWEPTEEQVEAMSKLIVFTDTALQTIASFVNIKLTEDELSALTEKVLESFTLSEENLETMAKLVELTESQLGEIASKITLTAEQLESLRGAKGDSYTITASDYVEIAKLVTLTAAQLEEIAHHITWEPTEEQMVAMAKLVRFSEEDLQLLASFVDIELTEDELQNLREKVLESFALSQEELEAIARFVTLDETQLGVIGEKISLTAEQLEMVASFVELNDTALDKLGKLLAPQLQLSEEELGVVAENLSESALVTVAENLPEESLKLIAENYTPTEETLEEIAEKVVVPAFSELSDEEKDSLQGKSGTSIVSIGATEDDFELVFTLSDGTVLRVGFPEIAKGEPGDSAFESAVKEGFAGNVSAWIESLKMTFDDLTEPDKNELTLTWSKLSAEEKAEIMTNLALQAEEWSDEDRALITSFAEVVLAAQPKTASLPEYSTIKEEAMIPFEQDGVNYKVSAATLAEKIIGLSVLPSYKGVGLSAYSFDEIAYISSIGLAPQFFEVGDTRNIFLSTGEECQLVILGMGHDVLEDGSAAGITWGMTHCLTETRPMLEEGVYLDFPETALGLWLGGTFKEQLPDGIRNNVVKVVKSGSYNNFTAEILIGSDVEVLGSGIGVGSNYAYYSSVDRRFKPQGFNATTTSKPWLSTHSTAASTGYLYYYASSATNIKTSSSDVALLGVSPVFCFK